MWTVHFENDICGFETWCKAHEKTILHVLRDVFTLSQQKEPLNGFPVENLVDLVKSQMRFENEQMLRLQSENLTLKAKTDATQQYIANEIERTRVELSQQSRIDRERWQEKYDQKDRRVEELLKEMSLREQKYNDQLSACTNLQSQFQARTGEFIETYMSGGSHAKGKLAEESYEALLNNLFPSAEIENCAKTASSCDLILNMGGTNRILFEVKNYKANVPTKEVEKFKRDLEHRQCHGVMCSVSSGIARRKAFQIEIVSGRWIALYLPNHQHGTQALEIAVQFILETNHQGILISDCANTANRGVFFSDEGVRKLNEFLERLSARDGEIIKQATHMLKTIQQHTALEIQHYIKSICDCAQT